MQCKARQNDMALVYTGYPTVKLKCKNQKSKIKIQEQAKSFGLF